MNTGIWPIDSYILFLGRVQRRENCKIKHLILASFFLILSLGLDLFRALSCSKGSLTLVSRCLFVFVQIPTASVVLIPFLGGFLNRFLVPRYPSVSLRLGCVRYRVARPNGEID